MRIGHHRKRCRSRPVEKAGEHRDAGNCAAVCDRVAVGATIDDVGPAACRRIDRRRRRRRSTALPSATKWSFPPPPRTVPPRTERESSCARGMSTSSMPLKLSASVGPAVIVAAVPPRVVGLVRVFADRLQPGRSSRSPAVDASAAVDDLWPMPAIETIVAAAGVQRVVSGACRAGCRRCRGR